MHHDVAIRNIGHAKEGAGALRCAKRHKLAQVEHIGLNGKLSRKARVADNTARAGAVFIADVACRLNRCIISNAEREVGNLTDKTAAGGGTFDGERAQVESLRDIDCGARARTDEAYNATGGAVRGLDGGGGNVFQSADAQGRTVLDLAYKQAGIVGTCRDGTIPNQVHWKLNGFHGEGSVLDRIRKKAHVARRTYVEVLAGTGETISDVNGQVARRLAQEGCRQGGSLIIARIGAHGINDVNRRVERHVLAADF